MSDLKSSLLKCIDKILEIKEGVGADIEKVDLITRTWSGERVGDGSFIDLLERMKPLPCIADVSHDVRVTASSSVKQGDLLLKSISMNSYPDEKKLRTDTGIRNVEKFYKIGEHYYRTIHIKKNLVTWDVQVRKVHRDEQER
jgi:hypothetical protein